MIDESELKNQSFREKFEHEVSMKFSAKSVIAFLIIASSFFSACELKSSSNDETVLKYTLTADGTEYILSKGSHIKGSLEIP